MKKSSQLKPPIRRPTSKKAPRKSLRTKLADIVVIITPGNKPNKGESPQKKPGLAILTLIIKLIAGLVALFKLFK